MPARLWRGKELVLSTKGVCPPLEEIRLRRKNKYNNIVATTYILKSLKTNKHYIGSSHENSAITRLKSHNSGKTKSTKFGRPWVIIHQESFSTCTEARKRELFLKSGQGRKWIKEGCSEW